MKEFLKGIAIAGTIVAAGYVAMKAYEAYYNAQIGDDFEDKFEDGFFEDEADDAAE